MTDRKCRCVVSPYLFTHSGGDTLRSVAIVVDNFDNCLLSVFWKRLDGGVSPFKSLLNAIEKRKLVRCVRISWPSPILGCTTFMLRGKYNCTLVTACYSYILNSHSHIYIYVYKTMSMSRSTGSYCGLWLRGRKCYSTAKYIVPKIARVVNWTCDVQCLHARSSWILGKLSSGSRFYGVQAS